MVLQALAPFTSSKAVFADCLIERSGHNADCPHTVTFIVSCKVAHNDVRIQSDHRDWPPCSAIARFISSIDTGVIGLRSTPFRACTGLVAATMVYCPSPVSTNSIRLPVSKPSAARTEAGMVTCPFEVTVAVAMITPRIGPLHFITILQQLPAAPCCPK